MIDFRRAEEHAPPNPRVWRTRSSASPRCSPPTRHPTTRRTFVISSRLTACGAVLLALTLVAMAWPISGQQVKRSSGSGGPRTRGAASADAAALAARQRFLDMFARAYFPGRTGQLLIVPREGDFITRPDPDVAYMHGSPWAYDVSIPLMFAGPAVRTGVYSMPAVQQDVAPTLAAALGVQMPPTATGRVLPVLRNGVCPTASDHAARPGWHAPGLLRSLRRVHANAYRPAPARRLVHSGAGQHPSDEHRRWALDDLDGSRSPRARNHRRQRVRSHPPPAPRPVRGSNAARSDGIDAGRRLAARDSWSRDHTGAGKHRPSGDAARGAWSVSAEWSASRARKLRSADGQAGPRIPPVSGCPSI